MDLVPSGFSRRTSAGADVVLRDDVAAALVAAGVAAPESLRPRAVAEYRGRGRPFGVEIPGAGRVFVRQYLHGGAMRRVTGDLYRGASRFLRELAALVAAGRAGAPVAEALGVVSVPAGLGMRRGWLILREIPGGVDGLRFLEDRPPPSRRRAVLEASGRAIRALHDAGIEHWDLHLKNLLVVPDDGVIVVDFDKASRRGELERDQRIKGLMRFERYAAKQAAAGACVSLADRMRVLRAYAGADWPQGEELRELARRFARHVAAHGVGQN